MPEWGLSGSPLVISNRVVVSAGGRDGRSLLLWNVQSGQLIASGGSSSVEYSSPYLTELAGVPQILQFNHLLRLYRNTNQNTNRSQLLLLR